MKEPLWRIVLCWGAVIAYLTVPLITYVLIVLSIESPGWKINEHLQEFKGLGTWFQALTALIFGLAGLNSWDKTVRINGRKQEESDGGRKIGKEHQNSGSRGSAPGP